MIGHVAHIPFALVSAVCAMLGLFSPAATQPLLALQAQSSSVGLPRFSSVTTGGSFTCALAIDGTAWCWGASPHGQAGATNSDPECRVDGFRLPCVRNPRRVAQLPKLVELDAGAEHVCGLTEPGDIYCWGKNIVGELGAPLETDRCSFRGPRFDDGTDTYTEACSRRPVKLASALRFKTVSAGNYFTCALDTDGLAYCWGSRADGYVGAGNCCNAELGVFQVDPALRFERLSADGNQACALTATGVAYCWGAGLSRAPLAVVAAEPFSMISRGWQHTCALSTTGRAFCWGYEDSGQFGRGSTVHSAASHPQLVRGEHSFRSIVAGFGTTCGTTTSGELYCWGVGYGLAVRAPDRCQGVDSRIPCATTPTRVPVSDAESVALSGHGHSCVVVSAEVLCWGEGRAGALGAGSRRYSRAPIRLQP